MENVSVFEKLKPHIMAIQLICNEEHITDDNLIDIVVNNNYFYVTYNGESVTHTGEVRENVTLYNLNNYKKDRKLCNVIDMMEG